MEKKSCQRGTDATSRAVARFLQGVPRHRPIGLVHNLVRASIESERDLTRYVLRVSAVCMVLAVAVDVVNQLTFFVDWPSAVRSWLISAVVAVAIAAPVSRTIGKAHLALYRAKLRADELGRTDPLTGLLNRRALFEEAGAAGLIALVIVDIDRFKRVNDAFGHVVGDEVLRAVAHMLGRLLGDCGPVGRLGGEEFALLSRDADVAALLGRLRRFRDHVAATPIVAGATRVSVTISAGVARRKPGQSFEQLYVEADRALYLAKAAGRNRIVTSEDLDELAGGAVVAGAREWQADTSVARPDHSRSASS